MKASKDLWRWRMKAALNLQQPWTSSFARERLKQNLQLLVGSRPGLWASYRPLPLEADPDIGALPGVEWVYPRMEQQSLVFCRANVFVTGRFGCQEPDALSSLVHPEELTGVLVPGLAFDHQGRRLGRGRGFYDRTLANFNALTVGVAAAIQRIAEVPAEPWDIQMQAVVTEQSVYWLED